MSLPARFSTVLVLVFVLSVGFASVASGESLSKAELEKLPQVVEWVYRNGAVESSVGCGEVCSNLWNAEHEPMGNSGAAQEIWEQLDEFEVADGLWPSMHELQRALGAAPLGTAGYNVGLIINRHQYILLKAGPAPSNPAYGCGSPYKITLKLDGEHYGPGFVATAKGAEWIAWDPCADGGDANFAWMPERQAGCPFGAAPGGPSFWSSSVYYWEKFSCGPKFYEPERPVYIETAHQRLRFTRPEAYTEQSGYPWGGVTDPGSEATEKALREALEHDRTLNEWLLAHLTGERPDPTAPPAPEEEYGGKSPGSKGRETPCAGKPVNCATGNEYTTQTDFSISGKGVPLTLKRTYNSQAAVAGSSGMFGYGWSSSFSDHLNINATAGTVAVVQSNGGSADYVGSLSSYGELAHPAWIQATLTHNTDGTFVYTLPSQEAFRFDASGRLLSQADRNGNLTTMTYAGGSDHLETVTDPAGRKLTLAYNAEGHVESVTDPMGHVARYTYASGGLATVTEPGETTARWQFKYDGTHQLTEETDGRGGKTVNEYNGAHQVTSQTDPAGHQLTFEYQTAHEPFETVTTNHATGAVTKESFDGAHDLSSITKGYGTSVATTETFEYNSAGEVTSVTNGDDQTRTYTYDSAGNQTSMRDPLGNESKWTYDSTHDVATTTTPKGETTTIARNAHGEAESISRPAPGGQTQVTHYTYNAYGQLTVVEDPLKRVSLYEYNANGDRTSQSDPEGDKQTWGYNQDSQLISSVTPRGHVTGAKESKFTTTIERDAQGRAIKVTQPLLHETKYTYDANGNLASITDPEGNITSYTYNANDELTKVEAPNKSVTETGYDGAGQVTSQTDGNKATTKYVRNAIEEITEVVDPLGHKTTKEYDLAGRLKSVTDASKRITSYGYDDAGRLLTIGYSDGSTPPVTYAYDSDGNRTSMVDGTGTTASIYDQFDRLTESTDGHGDATSFRYDLANEQTQITYPNGKAVTRTYDNAGRVKTVADWLEHTIKFAYDTNSNLVATTFPSGTSNEDNYTFNEADGMTEVKMSKGTEVLASLFYTRNKDSGITKATTKGLPGEEKPSFGYDENSRLTKGFGGATNKYDAANNPTKIAGSTYTYNAASELETSTGFKYTYNETGERTNMAPTTGPSTNYGYDQAGNLTGVSRAGEGGSSAISDVYTYNGDQLRMSETIASATSYLYWDMSGALPVVISDGSNSYIYGAGNIPVEQINNSTGTVLYLHPDQQGSTRLLTGSGGGKEASFTYGPYGGVTGYTGTVTTGLGYDGQYTNSDTGLVYLRARTYDPNTVQFLSVDPLVQWTHEPYTYAGDSPLTYGDPRGLIPWGTIAEGLGVGASCLLGPEVCGPVGLAVIDAHVIAADINAAETECSPWPGIVPALVGGAVGSLPFAGGFVAKQVWDASNGAFRTAATTGVEAGTLAGVGASGSASAGCGCSAG